MGRRATGRKDRFRLSLYIGEYHNTAFEVLLKKYKSKKEIIEAGLELLLEKNGVEVATPEVPKKISVQPLKIKGQPDIISERTDIISGRTNIISERTDIISEQTDKKKAKKEIGLMNFDGLGRVSKSLKEMEN